MEALEVYYHAYPSHEHWAGGWVGGIVGKSQHVKNQNV